MEKLISVIIPNHNRSTIGKCLEAAFSSKYGKYEVVVVDDCSTESFVDIIKKFPCTLLRLDTHGGVSKARNVGAFKSRGEILFFIDPDCLLQEDTLACVNREFSEQADANVIIGGTYTRIPYDGTFFSTFQSIYINFSETKKKEPDYIAGHAMIIDSALFRKYGGFPEQSLAMIEDVEYSHKMRRAGFKLIMSHRILVQHIFNYNLISSLKNAFRKSLYWTVYSLRNKDLFDDSGTASAEIKISAGLNILLITAFSHFVLFRKPLFLFSMLMILIVSLLINRKLLSVFFRTKGLFFGVRASLYFTLVYPVPVVIGAVAGTVMKLIIPPGPYRKA